MGIGAPGSADGEVPLARLVPNTQMQPTGRRGPRLRAGAALLVAKLRNVGLCGAGFRARS
jgi:hypothetical protein